MESLLFFNGIFDYMFKGINQVIREKQVAAVAGI